MNRVEQGRVFLFAEPHCRVWGCVVCVGGARGEADVLAWIGFGGGCAELTVELAQLPGLGLSCSVWFNW